MKFFIWGGGGRGILIRPDVSKMMPSSSSLSSKGSPSCISCWFFFQCLLVVLGESSKTEVWSRFHCCKLFDHLMLEKVFVSFVHRGPNEWEDGVSVRYGL